MGGILCHLLHQFPLPLGCESQQPPHRLIFHDWWLLDGFIIFFFAAFTVVALAAVVMDDYFAAATLILRLTFATLPASGFVPASPLTSVSVSLFTVYIRNKLHMDLQADKSLVIVKGPFFPRVVNPRYRICGTMCNARIQSSKARKTIF
jgi:hypothetical protein